MRVRTSSSPLFLPSFPLGSFFRLFLRQCVSWPPTSSPTNCTSRTIPQPSQEPASPCASGSSLQKRRFCSMTTSSLSTTSSTRCVRVCVLSCMIVCVLVISHPPISGPSAGCGGFGKRFHQSGAEVLSAAEAGGAEEDLHGESFTHHTHTTHMLQCCL